MFQPGCIQTVSCFTKFFLPFSSTKLTFCKNFAIQVAWFDLVHLDISGPMCCQLLSTDMIVALMWKLYILFDAREISKQCAGLIRNTISA